MTKCKYCQYRCRRFGRNASGTQRYRCLRWRKTFSEPRRCVGNMYLLFETACRATELLAEGNSIRSTARLLGIKTATIQSLLARAGAGCSELLRSKIRGLDVRHLELDEIWTFVRKKQRRVRAGDPDDVGDAFCYIAIERQTRLVVAWHLGKRDLRDTCRFVLKVRKATSKQRFQISTDGFEAYESALERGLSDRASYGRIVKVTKPGRVESVFGNPDVDAIETTYIERFNGTLRQWCKRMTRKTYAFSKDWGMLEAMLALNFAHYNFCRRHGTLKATPAMAAGVADHRWTVEELLENACVRRATSEELPAGRAGACYSKRVPSVGAR